MHLKLKGGSARYIVILGVGAAVFAAGLLELAFSQGWSDLKTRLLDDDSFAVVESLEAGKKLKHCPHHDHNSELDIDQLIYVLGNFETEKWHSARNKRTAKKHLSKHYDAFIKRIRREGLDGKININSAKLSQLVRLPHIGPSLAVKIAEYRDSHSRIGAIEELKEIEGIGSETYNAIRHYVKL